MAAFPSNVKEKVLLWSKRHCCICDKSCGPLIEVHHIVSPKDGGSETDIDNAIPLCFDCHGIIGGYNPRHPVGNKLSETEIKKIRNQTYDLYTSELVPIVDFKLVQKDPLKHKLLYKFPEVGFQITHTGGPFPVYANVVVKGFLDGKLFTEFHKVETNTDVDYYGGFRKWALNPGITTVGHFPLIEKSVQNGLFRAMVEVTLIDIWEYEHRLLPLLFTFDRTADDWYLEPSVEVIDR